MVSADTRTKYPFRAYGWGVPQDEAAQIDAVLGRLAQKYAELPHDHVAAVVQHVYARFSKSELREFVPLLVERRANDELARSMVARLDERLAHRGRAGEDTTVEA